MKSEPSRADVVAMIGEHLSEDADCAELQVDMELKFRESASVTESGWADHVKRFDSWLGKRLERLASRHAARCRAE